MPALKAMSKAPRHYIQGATGRPVACQSARAQIASRSLPAGVTHQAAVAGSAGSRTEGQSKGMRAIGLGSEAGCQELARLDPV